MYSNIRVSEKLEKELAPIFYKDQQIEYINPNKGYFYVSVGKFRSLGYSYGGYRVPFDYSINAAQSR